MPTSDNLMGLGMPAQLAGLIGGNPSVLTCVGTAQVGAAVVKTKNTELVTAGGATACVFNALSNVNEMFQIVNPAATTALVFVPVGHTLNGTLNASLSVAQNKSAILWQYKPKFWTSIVAA